MKNYDASADCLKGWGYWLAGLADKMTSHTTPSGYECEIHLASGQNLVGVGQDSALAVRDLLAKIISEAPMPPSVCEPVVTKKVSRDIPGALPQDQSCKKSAEDRRMETVTKSTLDTLGVTTKKTLHSQVISMAAERGLGVAELARNLIQDAFDRFEEEIETNDPTKVLRGYEQHARGFDGAESEQWVIRLDRSLSKLVRLAAKEHEKSISQMTAFFLAESLRHECLKSVSSHSNVEWLDKAVVALNTLSKPAAAKKLVRGIELGDQNRPLLNMVLEGEALAPIGVMKRIAAYFELPMQALSSALTLRFETRAVASFKASSGEKPTIRLEPMNWEDAVKSLQLPLDEEKRLLSLAKER